MKETKDVVACVVDHGLFIPIARRLARDFQKVYYWSPWEKTFPTLKDCVVGDGFDDIERVESIWDVKNSVDLFVFPDIGFAPLQGELIGQGFPVWGGRRADELEIYRGRFMHALQEQTTLPVPNYETVMGMTALREHLTDKEDKWIKISKYRGDWETMHWRSWEEDEATLDFYSVKFGPMKERITFYVFDSIDTMIEDGYDGYSIDGQFPSHCVHGMECKDKAYIGTFQKFKDLPDELRVVNDEFAPILGAYGYRGFFSTEVRITEDGKSYFIDPTLRAGSPPSQVMAELFSNMGEIIWQGANGTLVNPESAAKFAVQGLLSLKGDPRGWRLAELPSELDQWVKCGTCCKLGDRLCFPPDQDGTSQDIGWMVGIGDSMEEAIAHLRSNSNKLPDGVTCEFYALADLLKEIREAEEVGMEFTDQKVPNPSIITEDNEK